MCGVCDISHHYPLPGITILIFQFQFQSQSVSRLFQFQFDDVVHARLRLATRQQWRDHGNAYPKFEPQVKLVHLKSKVLVL